MKSPAEQRHLRINRSDSLLNRFLDLLSSVRFGIFLLILLIALSSVGMLVMQQNIDGFDRYISTMPEERRILFATLGLFDIYRSWYFTATLILLSVNIILASIERLPLALRYLRKPKVRAGDSWISTREFSERFTTPFATEDSVEAVREVIKRSLGRTVRISGEGDRKVIFAQRGESNRLGAYAVHVSLLIIFAGGFLTANFSYSGKMNLSPGVSSNQIVESAYQIEGMIQARRTLPFEVVCTDIEQVLVRQSGGLDNGNTIDWITRFVIEEADGRLSGAVSMNRPFDHRGYRFFQSSYVEIPRARHIELTIQRPDGSVERLKIERDGSGRLADGTEVRFTGFNADGGFRSSETEVIDLAYPDPVAILGIVKEGVPTKSVVASRRSNQAAEIGQITLAGFEKVSETHILSIQYDPGADVVYLGFILLGISLIWVFTTSHERLWISMKPSGSGTEVLIGADSNRGYNRIEMTADAIVAKLGAEAEKRCE